jgi:type I restriction enzyme S subunit
MGGKAAGEVCCKIGSGATPRGGKASYCQQGISLIRSMNVYDNSFVYSELAHISESQAKELANVTIEPCDVLINITGASVARCCVVPNDVIPARVNQHVSILRISSQSKLDPDFLCYSLVAPSKKRLLLGIGEAGSTRQALTKSDLSSFCISIPAVEEQKIIVKNVRNFAEKIKMLEQNYTQQIADCVEMRQAVLREAFEGRL